MKRILIADDEPHVIRILQRALERVGFHVDVAPHGEAALQMIRTQQPDVLITDIQMPRMTGQQLCQEIDREMPGRQFLIFVVTSRTEVEHREWSHKISNLSFLEKPVSTRRLISGIEAYFNIRDGAGRHEDGA